MLETGQSGLMSGEGKRAAASRPRPALFLDSTCAPTAQIISGRRIHLCSCRLDMVATERSGRATGRVEASGQKSAIGRAATLQAVTRVKPEQASKVKSWMPTRQLTGEGRHGQVPGPHCVRGTWCPASFRGEIFRELM